MNQFLTSNEIEMLLNFEHRGWEAAQSEADQASVRCLILRGLLIQDGQYAHITRHGIETANSVRNGSLAFVVSRALTDASE